MILRSKRYVLLAVAIATGLFVPPASAADDDGDRSVFALGAGNRPLGMGGAYAAIANDASAPLWNPGGIGLVLRKQFEVTQTGYYNLGINEQYASAVLPSWRWGALSATFRHYGVTGIEERDDRNVLIADDLSDHQTEFSLGYGKRLGAAWSVGGVLKLQSQSLAGFSGSGVGMDMGVVVKPLLAVAPNSSYRNRVTVGVAVRNLLEPNIRLANENVPDPIGVRVGTAVILPIFKDRNVLAAVDFEKTAQRSAGFQAGLEFSINPALALRTGIDNGVFTAGANVGWRDIDVSYAFENTDLGSINRLGLSLAFGPTVTESRQATLDAEEEKLQTSLAAAFDEQQRKRVGDLLAQADAARQSGDRSTALNILDVVAALDPGNQGTQSRQISILNEMAAENVAKGNYTEAMVTYSRVLNMAPSDATAKNGYERSRQASDSQAQRSVEIRGHFDAALQHFSTQDFENARDGFELVLQMSPRDEAAATMLRRTNQAIDHRCAELLQDAARFTEWGYFAEADGAIAEARRLNPSATGLAQAEARLTRAQQLARRGSTTSSDGTSTATPAPQATGKPELTAKQRQEVERLYAQGTEAMKAGRRFDAIKYLELVWSMDPAYRNTVEHLKRQYQTSGMEYFADGNIDRAEEVWERALRVDPTDQRTLSYLARAREQRAREKQIFGGGK